MLYFANATFRKEAVLEAGEEVRLVVVVFYSASIDSLREFWRRVGLYAYNYDPPNEIHSVKGLKELKRHFATVRMRKRFVDIDNGPMPKSLDVDYFLSLAE